MPIVFLLLGLFLQPNECGMAAENSLAGDGLANTKACGLPSPPY
jgi:hypothetical protein